MPRVIHKFFRYQKILLNRRVPLQKLSFRSCGKKEIGKIVMPPSYAWKFSKKGFFRKSTVFSNELFQYSHTKTFRRKIVIPPLLSIKNFCLPETFWKTEGFFYRSFRFGPVKQKILAKSWCPPPFYAWKFSEKEFFWNTKLFTNEKFWYSQTKNFRRKIVIIPIIHKSSPYPKISETLKVYPRTFPALWNQKYSTEKRDTPVFIHKTLWN